MPTVLVRGTDASISSIGAPSYLQINDALSSILITGATGEIGGWVGPRPRVTRVVDTGAPRAWLVRFAWPYSWTSGPGIDDARVRRQIVEAAQRQLAPTSSDWQIGLDEFTPAVNGELSWWQLGSASVTQTADEFPTAGGRLDAAENPIGPTTSATHPTTIAGAAGAAADKVTDFLKALWPLAAIGVGVYVADKLGAFTPRRKPRAAPAPKARRSRVDDLEPLETWDPFRLPAGARSNPDTARNSVFGFDTVRLSPSEEKRWRSDAAFRSRLGGQLHRAAKQSGRDVILMDSRLGYVTTIQPNPRPPEWGQYAPSTPYPCHPYESKIMGLVVPGRGGGTVSACATPAEPITAKRRRGQVQIGLPGVGAVMPKSRARARVRRAGLEILKTPVEDVAQAAAAYSRSRCAIPYPPGLEFPHTVSKCDREHKVWAGYESALEDAQEAASIVGENAGPEEFDCLVREALERDPRFPVWEAAASQCTRSFQSRQSERRGKAQFSSQRERGQERARAIASGEDVTGAEYRDAMALRRNPFIGGR